MKKKYKKILKLIILIIIIIAILILSKIFFGKEKVKNNVKVIDSIVDFSYTLDERDTKLMKDTYEELKKVLKEKDINYEEYAKVLSKLFVIDLFTMENKINKYVYKSVLGIIWFPFLCAYLVNGNILIK